MRWKASGLVDFEAAILLPPLVEGSLTDAVPPTEFGNGRTGLVFSEDLEICSSVCRVFMVELCAAFAADSQLIPGLNPGRRSELPPATLYWLERGEQSITPGRSRLILDRLKRGLSDVFEGWRF